MADCRALPPHSFRRGPPLVATRLTGSCKALYCLGLARGIDLERAEDSLTTSRRTAFQHKSRVPEGVGVVRPLRVSWTVRPEVLGSWETASEVEVALYEFGAVCMTWNVAVEGEPETLVALSALLYDNAALIARSRELAVEVSAALGAALDRPRLSTFVEDYAVFELEPVAVGPEALLATSRSALARILRAESVELSSQEIEDALAHPVSYGRFDLCLVDWLAALLVGGDMADERTVLEIATVELLELRRLDAHLEGEIGEAYDLLARPRTLLGALAGQRKELERIARIQADEALLHEGIDNALKLFGDDYLARLYRTAALRFHFEDWDGSIRRKLGVLREVYESLANQASHRRSEALEWIIILLIAVEIVLYFTPLQ